MLLDRLKLTRAVVCEDEECEETERIQAHHDSYERDQWRVVRWLCLVHHHEADDEREAKG